METVNLHLHGTVPNQLTNIHFRVKYFCSYPKRHQNDYCTIRSGEGLVTLKTSALESLYGGQITLETLLINQTFLSTSHRRSTAVSFETDFFTLYMAILDFSTLRSTNPQCPPPPSFLYATPSRRSEKNQSVFTTDPRPRV